MLFTKEKNFLLTMLVYFVLANSCVFAQESIKEFPQEIDNIKIPSSVEIDLEKSRIEILKPFH